MKPSALARAAVTFFAVTGLAGSLSANPPPQTPWYDGLGRHSRLISTAHEGAQGYFDQGLAFLAAANPEEARRSFEEAARFDPQCAMAYWGIAMTHGPQLEWPRIGSQREVAAVAAINRAHELCQRTTPVEQALIAALATRHRDPPMPDREALDKAYADAMHALHRRFPQDPDIAAWAAEARLINELNDGWAKDGELSPSVRPAREVLAAALQLDARHPLANRLWVELHLQLKDPTPAAAAAQHLHELAPGLGHFFDLAARFELRRGQWEQALALGERALQADARWRELAAREPDLYRVMLARHRFTLVQAAAMSGQSAVALSHARALLSDLPDEWVTRHRAAAEPWLTIPLQVLVRFGRWPEVLTEPEPSKELDLLQGWLATARGLAAAAQGDAAGAERAWQEMLTSAEASEGSGTDHLARRGWTWRALQLATAERLAQRGDLDEALAVWRESAPAERGDSFGSIESPWLISPTHVIGAYLLQARRWTEAEKVYRTDLEWWPGNVWSLRGLADALFGQERVEEAAKVEAQFSIAARAADAPIPSSWPLLTVSAGQTRIADR